MMDLLIRTIEHAVLDTLPMIPVLVLLYAVLEYFSHERGIDLLASAGVSGRLGPLAGTLLGILPECGMSVFMTSLYLSRRITLGTLVATYLATSDEALPVLLAQGGQGAVIFKIAGLKAIVGIVAGYSLDFLLKRELYSGPPRQEFSSHVAEVVTELRRTAILRVVRHSINRTVRIYLWVLAITALLGVALHAGGTFEWLSTIPGHSWLEVILVGAFGLIPNCGASIAIAEGYLHAGLSFGATVAGLSAGAGYGPIVLIKDGDRRNAVRLLLICLLISIVYGFLVNVLFP
jgi:hypothetical protein